MSSRIPSSLVRRFDYRLSSPLLLARQQWERMLELAELNHWGPFPLPGFSFARYRHTIYSHGPYQPDLLVDYDDFVLDFSMQIGARVPANSSFYFLSDNILLADDLAPNSFVMAFWMLGPYTTAVIEPYLLCFTLSVAAVPGDLVFQRLVVPTRYNVSSFRLIFPEEDHPVFAIGSTIVNRFLPEGEPIPVP
jgi:hypothetical protein